MKNGRRPGAKKEERQAKKEGDSIQEKVRKNLKIKRRGGNVRKKEWKEEREQEKGEKLLCRENL